MQLQLDFFAGYAYFYLENPNQSSVNSNKSSQKKLRERAGSGLVFYSTLSSTMLSLLPPFRGVANATPLTILEHSAIKLYTITKNNIPTNKWQL